MSDSELFVDGILNVTLMKGLVRVDLYSLSATEAQKNGQPLPEFRQRLVMHPQALLEMMQSLQVAINALNQKGMLNLKLPSNDPQMPPPMGAALGAGAVGIPLVSAGLPAGAAAPATAPDHAQPAEPQEAAEPAAPAPANRPRSRNFPSTLSS